LIIGVGVDIVELSRIRSAHKRWGERLLVRLFTKGELEFMAARADVCPYLASRFAAKEAFLKALGTGFARGISWQDMEVIREEGRRPFFNISGRALQIMEEMGVKNIHLSMSHERKYSVAQVILEGPVE